jgi:hypothetical protein
MESPVAAYLQAKGVNTLSSSPIRPAISLRVFHILLSCVVAVRWSATPVEDDRFYAGKDRQALADFYHCA